MALDALIGMAMFLIEEGGKERAIKLLALVLYHPASWQIFKDRSTHLAKHLIAELENELPYDVVTNAQEQGKALDLWETAAELLALFDEKTLDRE
jgi:hypothetical protein